MRSYELESRLLLAKGRHVNHKSLYNQPKSTGYMYKRSLIQSCMQHIPSLEPRRELHYLTRECTRKPISRESRSDAISVFKCNRPRSIYQYSSMAPRLSGQNCKFFKLLLSLNSQKRLAYKENNTKYRILTRKPRSHVRILIYRTWPI